MKLESSVIQIIAAAQTFCLLAFAGCTATVKTDQREQIVLETNVGDATFYARHFQGNTTASGIKFDNRTAVAAHRTYPFCTVVRVTNLENGRALNVAIVDRGPFGKNHREGAIIDLSRAAAEGLGMIEDGQVRVKLEVLLWGNERTGDATGGSRPACPK